VWAFVPCRLTPPDKIVAAQYLRILMAATVLVGSVGKYLLLAKQHDGRSGTVHQDDRNAESDQHRRKYE
jgi:hypothetical protein